MTIKQLHKRLDQLSPGHADTENPDLALAARWNDSAGRRRYELWNKTEPLTDKERMECAHLDACQKAWRHLHSPEEFERERVACEVYGWTPADSNRHWELLLKEFRHPTSLTDEERNEFKMLEARRPPPPEQLKLLQDELAAIERALGGLTRGE